tara:strand:+ start:1386 stop:1691 length:306 start_codon:yes stop_codon:yes gene_type:complete
MALTEKIEYDKIEVVSKYKHIQIRKATVIEKDGVELTRTYSRYALTCGTLDDSDNFVDTVLDKEPDGVTAIPDDIKQTCNLHWTDDVKALYKTQLLANKPS